MYEVKILGKLKYNIIPFQCHGCVTIYRSTAVQLVAEITAARTCQVVHIYWIGTTGILKLCYLIIQAVSSFGT